MHIKINCLHILIFLTALLTFNSCNKSTDSLYVNVHKQRIETPEGQQIFIKGINVVDKTRRNNFVPHYTFKTYQQIRNNGFNCIRLGFNWSAIEPQPLKYNQDYLQELDDQIRIIKSLGMYIILDMHQDLFSVKFGNGAPLWATMDDNKPYKKNGYSKRADAYLQDQAVQTAFDNFWTNKKIGNSNYGLQDYYIKLWQLIAKRYTNEKSIIGYDIMNEPFIGSKASDAINNMCASFTKIDTAYTSDKIKEIWNSNKDLSQIVDKLSTIGNYKAVIQSAESIYQDFEKNELQPFYQNVANAIRNVDANHILFLEPSVSSNNGVTSVIQATKLKNGKNKDQNVVYIPHIYDIVKDTPLASEANTDRLVFILTQLQKTANDNKIPLCIGEWGAFHNCDKCENVAKTMTNMFEVNNTSNIFWDYQPGLWYQSYFKAMQTIYPQKVDGTLTSFVNTDRTSIIKWNQKNFNPSIIYIPDTDRIESIDTDPNVDTQIRLFTNSKSGLLIVSPVKNKKNINIKLTISVR